MEYTQILDEETDRRLDNWGRWNRDHPQRGHCRSIEHRYQASKGGEVASPGAPQVFHCTDVRDALAVHRAWRDLPQVERVILSQHYIKAANPRTTARLTGVRWDCYGERLRTAVVMVKNRLKK